MAELSWGSHCLMTSSGFFKPCALLRSVMAAILFLAAMTASQTVSTVPPPGGECEAQFMQGLFDCFVRHGVPFNTYLWVAGDKSGGVPPEDETAFRQHMCSVEEDVVDCTLDVLHSLVGADFCRDTTGMDSLLTVQVHAIFDEYDDYCANECRRTLEEDMRKCYPEHDLDPSLFLPKMSDGAILGKTEFAVDKFCQNRTSLLACIRRKVDACSESPFVLRRLGLDVEKLDGGVNLLCQRKEDYLSSLECFREQTRAVEKCLEELGHKLLNLVSQNGTKTKVEVSDQFCLARIDFIQCDLAAWARKGSRACDSDALILKRDFHCNQLPTMCKDGSGTIRDLTKEVCDATPYITETVESPEAYAEGNGGEKMAVSVFSFCAILAALLL